MNAPQLKIGLVVGLLGVAVVASFFVPHTTEEPQWRQKERAAIQLVQQIHRLVTGYLESSDAYPCQDGASNGNGDLFPCLVRVIAAWDPEGFRRVGIPHEKIVHWDTTVQSFVPASAEDIANGKCDGYILDPWGNSMVYRLVGASDSSGRQDLRALVYSIGPNGLDETIQGTEGDDIGNW